MDSDQYEELCRHFIAGKTGLTPDDVKSVKIPNPRRPGLPEYKHQIDLYWETGIEIAMYLNIADVKWRGTAKVDQPEILILQQVRQKVGAHKAFLITNVGFTAGAIAAAKDDGIALHIVVPSFDASSLPKGDRAAVQARLRELDCSGAIYSHELVNRGFGFIAPTDGHGPMPDVAPGLGPAPYETRVLPASSRLTPGPVLDRTIRGGTVRGDRGLGPDRTGGGGIVRK